jgi:hypothetical protein
MIFGNFRKAQPPLTAYCTKLAEPANLLNLADLMTTGGSAGIDKRAVVLSLVIMAAAGHFVGRLDWDPQRGMWDGSRRYLRDTNLDVITAESMMWIHFLLGEFWRGDREKDREMYERVGYATLSSGAQLALDMIEKQTGVDFKKRGIESRKLYLEAIKDRTGLFEPFATVVLRSIGRRSLAEPLNTIELLPPLEWTPLSLNVGIFFSTMPLAFYETFKNILREWPDRFPNDEDFDE